MKKNILFVLGFAIFFAFNSNQVNAQIDFTQSTSQGCAPLNVTLTYTGTEPTASRIDWYFNDGSPMVSTTLPTTTVTHTYQAGYLYPYIFVYDATNNYLDQTYSSQGPINSIGAVNINGPDSICLNDKAYFQPNGLYNSLSWNFGDGTTSVLEYPEHIYTSLGTKTVTLTANTTCGIYVSTHTIVVTSILVPTPNIYANPSYTVCPNHVINFQPGGIFATYSWNFGDGTTSNVQYPAHSYTTTGVKTVSLTVTNGCGNMASKTMTVSIANGLGFPGGTSIDTYDNKVCPGEEVQGYVNGGSGYPKYVWNYGDASPLDSTSGTYFSHTYYTLGTYSVSCKITNHCGISNTFYTAVTVANQVYFPNNSWFQINMSSNPTCPNSKVGFSSPGGNFANYEWNFGDGSPLVSTTNGGVNHTYGSTITTYTVSLKITNLCGNDTTLYKTLTISNTAPFSSSSNSNFNLDVYESPSCPNSEISFSTPSGYSNYQWNFGDGSPVLNNKFSGYNHTYGSALTTYTASVKITNTCGIDTTVKKPVTIVGSLPFPNQSWFALSSNSGGSAVCPGDKVEWNAPNGYSIYNWNLGDGTIFTSAQSNVSHTYTAIGTYSASVMITNACGNTTTLNAVQVINSVGSFPSNISLSASPNTGSCPGDLVNFNLQGGSFISYKWSFGDGDTLTTSGNNIQHSYSVTGNYNVSCIIKNACGNSLTVNKVVSVINNAPISSNINLEGITNPSCIGDKVYININDGKPSYQYVWNFGDGSIQDTSVGSGVSYSYSATGTYTVSMSAKNGCGLSKTVYLTEVISNTVVPTLTGDYGDKNWGFPSSEGNNGGVETAGCAGDAIIFYFKGTAATNLWDFGDGYTGVATEQMLIGGDGGGFPVTIIKHAFAANGQYKIKLTITNGCGNSVKDSMMINIGGNQAVNGELITSPPPFTTCSAVDFLAYGGATYEWNFGDGTPMVNTSSPTISHSFSTLGVYFVSVKITNGCGNTATYNRSVYVNGASGPSVALTSSVTPTCFGGNNGSATVSIASGQAPYSYLWTTANGQTTASATGLSAGLHYVVVKDNIGCESSFAVSIANPAAITLATSSVNSACGQQTGSATVNLTSGGTSPYLYSWSTGATTTTISGLGLGQYPVVIADANGCTSTKNISISEINGPVLAVNATTSVSCFGGSNGAIDINVSGASAPYSYVWSNAATIQDVTGLAAGNYSVVVADALGCKSILNATVAQSSSITATPSIVKAPTCGNFDGKASVDVIGGNSPYTYLWPGANNQTTQLATGLPAGTYTVIVTDSKGCVKNATLSLSNSNAPSISSIVSNVLCNGSSNGSIDLTVLGGTSPYLYTWNVGPPQTNNQDVFGLAPGTYFVTVNDAKGCQSFQLFNITQPTVLTNSIITTGATCGKTDGTSSAFPTGGNTPYNYLWSGGGQTSQTATGLALGNYSVTITDNKGCTTSGTTTVIATTNAVSICAISVDNTSKKNVIAWEKPIATNIDSFRIYRDIATVYTHVGSVAYTDSSYFIDNTNGVNPNITSYKYKTKVLDTCGVESAFSSMHQTMHLQVNVAAPPNSFNLSWSDYLGFPVTQYRIMVDSLNNGNWIARDSVSFGSPKQWTDTYHYPDTVNYMIEVDHPTGCAISIKNFNPMASNLNLSKSNINKIQDTTLNPFVANIYNELAVSLSPNPTNGLFVVEIKSQVKAMVKIKIYNLLGVEIANQEFNSNISRYSLDLSGQPKGVYFVQISELQKTTTKKIVVE